MEMAHRGTLFLDEIGDVDPAVQAKLLKALEEMRFRRLGDVQDRRVDVRLIAATSATWTTWWRPAGSARTSTTGSGASSSGCLPCASVNAT
jgi:sigma54-dependent transcription regulator